MKYILLLIIAAALIGGIHGLRDNEDRTGGALRQDEGRDQPGLRRTPWDMWGVPNPGAYKQLRPTAVPEVRPKAPTPGISAETVGAEAGPAPAPVVEEVDAQDNDAMGQGAPTGSGSVWLTYYLPTGYRMANGEWPYEGAVACWDGLLLGAYLRIDGDPTDRTYRCADRGLGGTALHCGCPWVDVFFKDEAVAKGWLTQVGTTATISWWE